MTCSCPACGQPVPSTDGVQFDYDTGVLIARDQAVQLTPRQSDMMKVLMEAHPRPISYGQMMDTIYGGIWEMPDKKCLQVQAVYANKRLKDCGVKIIARFRHGFHLEINA